MAENYIYKTNPNYFILLVMAGGATGFALISRYIWSAGIIAHRATENNPIVEYILVGLFLALGIGCLAMVIGFRVFYLTEGELIYKRPLLFFSQTISLADMMTFGEEDNKINMSSDPFKTDMMSIGQTTTITTNSGKRVKISSLEAWGHDELLKKIHQQIRINKDRRRQ